MASLQLFDRPLCCSTGICGPEVDPALVALAADLAWLARKGVAVERINPAQQPWPLPPIRRSAKSCTPTATTACRSCSSMARS